MNLVKIALVAVLAGVTVYLQQQQITALEAKIELLDQRLISANDSAVDRENALQDELEGRIGPLEQDMDAVKFVTGLQAP